MKMVSPGQIWMAEAYLCLCFTEDLRAQGPLMMWYDTKALKGLMMFLPKRQSVNVCSLFAIVWVVLRVSAPYSRTDLTKLNILSLVLVLISLGPHTFPSTSIWKFLFLFAFKFLYLLMLLNYCLHFYNDIFEQNRLKQQIA